MAQSTVKLIVDAQNAINPLRRVNDATKNLSKNTDKLKNRLNKSNRSIRESGRAATVASGGFRTLNRSLGPLLKILATIAATRFVFINAAEIETQRKSLEVLTGSLSETNKIIKELQDFGAVTPFTSSELIEQSKRLKAFGFETGELANSVKRLSDIAGATGADLSGIATAFGQIRAKGKLQQEENLQLLERGVDITTELKRITGLQGEEFESAMRKGKIGADLVNQAFINLTNEGGAFFGGATAQAETLNGKLSTLIDSVQSLARTVGEVLGPAIKTALSLATSAVQKIDNLIKRVQNIGKIGLSGVVEAEQEARKTAERLTKLKFGDDVKIGFLGDKEATKFFNEQRKLIEKQIINREKLKKISFQQVEVLEDVTKESEKIKQKTEGTTLAFTTAFTNANLFNESLGQTNIFMDSINNQANSFSTDLINATSEADQLKEKFMEIGQGIEDGIVSGLTDAVMGTKSLAEAATGVLNNLKRQLVEVAMQRAASGIGNFFGKALGGIFGGGGGGSLLSGGNNFKGLFSGDIDFTGGSLLSFANGGRPPVGKASIVGERGPELFVPSVAGTIMPNGKIGGGGITNIVNVSVNASGSSVSGNTADANALGNVIAVAIRSELIKEKRAGGLLSK